MLPTLPQPPTDNLYKFCAIVGVLVAAASIILPGEQLIALNAKMQDLTRQISIAEVEVEMSGQKLRRLHSLIDNSIAVQNGRSVTSLDKLTLRYSDDEIKRRLDEAEDTQRLERIRAVELRHLHSSHRSSLWILAAVLAVGCFGTVAGVMLARFGFKNWFEKVQAPADRAIARAEAHGKPESDGAHAPPVARANDLTLQ